jgi:2,4-dienoyl-CoA reductase-like NADH-dependent reductase (Old Yellow Enzyme family)
MTSSTDAHEMAESGVAAHALLFEPLTLPDLTIKNGAWLSARCQHMVTVEDGVGIWCISAHERRAGPG